MITLLDLTRITMESFHEVSKAFRYLDERAIDYVFEKELFIAYEEGSRLLLLRIKRQLHPSHHR